LNDHNTQTRTLPAPLRRLAILEPLAVGDFALLFAGMTVSLIGDGIYLVAIAWQVYELSNAPTALSVVGIAWSVPVVLFVLVGGVLSDRVDRRRIMLAAHIVRGLAVAAIGVLSVAGLLELWHVIVLVAVYGVGEALFGPAFGAIVPDIVPASQLVQANSLSQVIEPIGLRLAGPALGGFAIAALGVGVAFLFDAASFAFAAGSLLLMRSRFVPEREEGRSIRGDLGEASRFVRSQPWLWGTLLSAAFGLLAFVGPVEVLVPFIVKNQLGGGAAELGFVFAAGGFGALLAALVMGHRGLPRRHMTFLYVTWTIGTLLLAGFGLATAIWQAMAVSFLIQAFFAAGLIVWATLMHRLVPSDLLGRVSSLDWLVSASLMPVSFALTGPLADAIGADVTLIAAGILAGLATLAFLFMPGMRETERSGLPRIPEEAAELVVGTEPDAAWVGVAGETR
jgi:DHA3 family tetracycline resistance protein-like MFS transporter